MNQLSKAKSSKRLYRKANSLRSAGSTFIGSLESAFKNINVRDFLSLAISQNSLNVSSASACFLVSMSRTVFNNSRNLKFLFEK